MNNDPSAALPTSAASPKSTEEILYPTTPTKQPEMAGAAAPERKSVDPKLPSDPNAQSGVAGPAPAEAYRLTAPEGFEVTPEVLAEVAPVFQEIGLDSEKANKLMPLASKFAERILQGQADAFQTMTSDWAKASTSDPKIGQGNLKETQRLVDKALKAAGSARGSEFRNLMDETGIGNHPETLRVFRFFGELLETRASGPKSTEQVWYPTMTPR